MKLFVYEHLSATTPAGESNSLLREGRAMLSAVLSDFAADGHEVSTIVADASVTAPAHYAELVYPADGLNATIARLARAADRCVIVAPEPDGILASICEFVERTGGILLGPPVELVKLFADKLATSAHLGALAIPTSLITPHSPIPTLHSSLTTHHRSVVIKPRDGAGACFTVACDCNDVLTVADWLAKSGCTSELVAQPFWPGTPASIAIVGREGSSHVILPAVEQMIVLRPELASIAGSTRQTKVGRLSYEGGRLPLANSLHTRAVALVERFIEMFPDISGYVGLDLILGSSADGAFDRIVEVNPRLTTSYVGYSRLLPGRMGKILLGEQASIAFNPVRRIRFLPDGRITEDV